MSPKKAFCDMTTCELKQATREFDTEAAGQTFEQPTQRQRAQLARAKHNRVGYDRPFRPQAVGC